MSDARVVFRYRDASYTAQEGQLLGRIATSPVPFNEDGFVSREHAVLSSRRGRPVLVPVRGRLWRNGREELHTCGLVEEDRIRLSSDTELTVERVRNAHRVSLVDTGSFQRWVVLASNILVSVTAEGLTFLPMSEDRPDLPRLFEGSDEAWHLERPSEAPETVYFGDEITLGARQLRLEAEPVRQHDANTEINQALDVRMWLDEPNEPGHTHIVGVTDRPDAEQGPLRGRSHRLWSRVFVLEALRGGAVHRDDILRAVWGPGVKPHTFDQTKSVLNRNCGVRDLRAPLTNQRADDAPGTWRLVRNPGDRFTVLAAGVSCTYEELELGRGAVLPEADGRVRSEVWREIVASVGADHRLKALLIRIREAIDA